MKGDKIPLIGQVLDSQSCARSGDHQVGNNTSIASFLIFHISFSTLIFCSVSTAVILLVL